MLGGFIALPMTDQWASGITQSKLIKAQGAAHPPLTLPVAAAGVPAVARWGSRCGWQRMARAKALREAMLTGMVGDWNGTRGQQGLALGCCCCFAAPALRTKCRRNRVSNTISSPLSPPSPRLDQVKIREAELRRGRHYVSKLLYYCYCCQPFHPK